MIHRLHTKDEQRAVRLRLYSDDVYVIAHKALREMPLTFSIEEVFSTAETFAYHLLANHITEADFISMEVDDLLEELDNEQDLLPIITIAFVKLCALRKANPIAADVARSLVFRCQQYKHFTPLLAKLADAENKRVVQKGRIDLMHYELKTLEQQGLDPNTPMVIDSLVDIALKMDTNDQKVVERVFSRFNDSNNHIIQPQLDRLRQHTDHCTENQNLPTTINTQGGTVFLECDVNNSTINQQKQIESK